MDGNNDGSSVSLKKLEANRRNAQQSTGPKSEEGKNWSRLNAETHGILSSALLIIKGKGAEDTGGFNELLSALRQDLAPVGTFEEMLVEKIAVCWWRQQRALRCEAGIVRRTFEDDLRDFEVMSNPERAKISDHLILPLGPKLDQIQILRYEASIHRQLAYAINQLERVQRARKGEHVPAPVEVHISSDQ